MFESELPLLIFVGGFLGAGKTTLIMEAASRLAKRGTRTAVIMNDQDHELVDTKVAQANGLNAGEVAGGCFCCKLSDLLDTADKLLAYRPTLIFAEPVGSCIDLSATLLKPLNAFYAARYRVAPLTVLVDPELAHRVCSGAADKDTTYLFRNQIAEADLIAITKIDVFCDFPNLAMPVAARLSGKTGEGVDEWLRTVLDGDRVVGSRLLDIDYDRYADAEAALGWVNVHGKIELESATSPAGLAGPLIDAVERALTSADIRIAHLKIFDRNAFGYVRASVCRNGDEALPDGDLIAEPSNRHEIAINLRAIAPPETLQDVVMSAFARIAGTVHFTHSAAFRPARPRPECRMGNRVTSHAKP